MFVAILPDGHQVFIDRQQVGVFVIIYVFANKWMPGPLWCTSGECPKGHEISMNSRGEVISILLLLLPGPKGLCAQLPLWKKAPLLKYVTWVKSHTDKSLHKRNAFLKFCASLKANLGLDPGYWIRNFNLSVPFLFSAAKTQTRMEL